MVVLFFPAATARGLDWALEPGELSWSDGGLMTACISTWLGGLHQGRQGTTINWLYSMVPITRNMKPSTAALQSLLHGLTRKRLKNTIPITGNVKPSTATHKGVN